MVSDQYYTISNYGPVNTGKSSVFGWLLSSFGSNCDSSKMHEFTDSLQFERENNITLAVAHKFAYWQDIRLHFKDEPGHDNLLGQAISGLWQTDLVLHMIDPINFNLLEYQKQKELLDWLDLRNRIQVVGYCDQLADHTLNKDDLDPKHPTIFVSGKDGTNIGDHLKPLLLNKLRKFTVGEKTKSKIMRGYIWNKEFKDFYLITEDRKRLGGDRLIVDVDKYSLNVDQICLKLKEPTSGYCVAVDSETRKVIGLLKSE